MVAGQAIAADQGPEELVAAVRDGSVTYEDAGARLGALIQHAHDWAARIRTEAETESIKTRERAKQSAQKMIEDAEREAATIRRKAEQDAAERIAYARSRVAELQEAIAAVAEHGATLRGHLRTAAAVLDGLDTTVDLPEGITVDASLLDLDVGDEPGAQTSGSKGEPSELAEENADADPGVQS